MANNFESNPIQIDTAGAGTNFGPGVFLTAVVVVASADTWSLILHDRQGENVIFRADSNIANHRTITFSLAEPVEISGVYATTLTDIALALVYTTRDTK